jgi:hypothetical protein
MDGTRKDTEDTTLVQSEEDMMRTIRALPFVTKLSPVGARNSHGHVYQVSLRCPSCEEYTWKETRVTSSSLQLAPNRARMLTDNLPVCRITG